MSQSLLYLTHYNHYRTRSESDVSTSEIARLLRNGSCRTDRDFDKLLPKDLRERSSLHWTPLEVVRRAAQWIDELGIQTVVDVGSGAGKFCAAAALNSKANYLGIEQRYRLVLAARELASVLDVERQVTFIQGTLTDLPRADAYYMYNPFGENLFGWDGQIDSDVELSEERYRRDVATSVRLLAAAQVGTYLITYNGFGGEVPASYKEVRLDRELPNVLRMWRKQAQTQARGLSSAASTRA